MLQYWLLLLLVCAGCGKSSSKSNDENVNEFSKHTFCQADHSISDFFTDVEEGQDLAPSPGAVNVTRRRPVMIDIKSIREVLADAVGKKIELALFKDKVFSVFIEKIQTPAVHTMIVTGNLGDPSTSLTMILHNDVLIANLIPNDHYQYFIRYSNDKVHLIEELDQSVSIGDSKDIAVPNPESGHESLKSSNQSTAFDQPPVIDMLVVYTPSALALAGSQDAMLALIEMGIADTNKAFVDSGVDLSVRLVGTLGLKENETSDFSSDLDDLKGKYDGKWDEVHAARVQLGADQVTLVGAYPDGGNIAGIGFLYSTVSTAFTIVKSNAFTQFTFSHELGHNLGLNHSDGLENPTGGFRTVMAYGSYRRIPRYSNPSTPYSGYETGDADHFSAQILNANGYGIASLLPPVLPYVESQVPRTLTECP